MPLIGRSWYLWSRITRESTAKKDREEVKKCQEVELETCLIP
jgi:hypothetical protein